MKEKEKKKKKGFLEKLQIFSAADLIVIKSL